MALFLVFLLATPLLAADPVAENLTETDEAEYRQGGIAAPGYPAGLYGAGPASYQQYAAGGGAGYMNVLRNLYRPPSLGLTDKVKHWVKSFMNRRQAVKPFYGAPGLQYQPDEFGAAKPMLVANGYKAISVPLRQLQKYYKTPFYGGEAGQFQNPQQQPASASSSVLSYSSPGAGGLYASETANNGAGALFPGGNSGLFGAGGSSGLFAQGSGNLFGSDASGALFANGGSPGAGLFSGSPGGMYSSGGAPGYFPSAGDETASALFGASGLTGPYAASAGNSGGLYQHQSSGSPSGGGSAYSLDGGSSNFGSEAGSQSYFGNGGASQYGADLYASGASPQASVYNPNEQQNRGYNGGSSKKQQKYGASSSALYIPSSSDSMRMSESHQMRSGSQEGQNSFSVDSSRGGAQETSYSVSFQPAQGKSYSASYDNSGFQPVSFGSEEGFKGKSS